MTWDDINAAGIVFLPAAGDRNSDNASKVINVGIGGFYWSSTDDGNEADVVYFNGSDVPSYSSLPRDSGHSVRLITECQ